METRELAQRTTNGVEVTLAWRPADDALLLVVEDAANEQRFELELAPGEALDAFEHPYAYAAFRGVDVAGTLEPLRL